MFCLHVIHNYCENIKVTKYTVAVSLDMTELPTVASYNKSKVLPRFARKVSIPSSNDKFMFSVV